MEDWSKTLNILVSGLHKRKARNAVLVTLLLVFVLSQAVIYTPYMQVRLCLRDFLNNLLVTDRQGSPRYLKHSYN